MDRDEAIAYLKTQGWVLLGEDFLVCPHNFAHATVKEREAYEILSK